MAVLIAAIVGMLCTVSGHVALWRILQPVSPVRLVPVCGFLGAAIALVAVFQFLGTVSLFVTIEFALLFLGLLSCYVISLPALEAESPSSLITLLVASKGPAGASDAQLRALINDETFVLNRLRGLEAEGFVLRRGSALSLTRSGRRFLDLFTWYHRLAGRLTKGG